MLVERGGKLGDTGAGGVHGAKVLEVES
jgi:hypothetical protein